MLPCHICYIYGTWSSKEVEGFKLPYGGKIKGLEKTTQSKSEGEGSTFYGGVDP